MSLKHQLELAFPNLEFELGRRSCKIWFGKIRKSYKTIYFKKDSHINAIYRFRNFYVISIYGIKDAIIISLKESYKIFQVLYEQCTNLDLYK